MAKVKSVLFDVALGIIFGTLGVSIIAPGFLTWYNIPGGGGALCNCAEVVRSTASSILHTQAVGAAVGAVLFAIGGALWRRRQDNTNTL